MAFGPRTVRAVTHLDVSRADCARAAEVLAAAGAHERAALVRRPRGWRAWLEAQPRDGAAEVWIGMYKKHSPAPH